jgi:RNA polymerase sigma-70 factor (ECF subfamily)
MDAAPAGAYEAARAAWPDVAIEREAFAAHLAITGAAIDSAHLGDLYLACGLARGQPDALAAFDRTLLAEVSLFVAHVDSTPSFVDELRQRLRTKLLVSPTPGAPPKIAEYAGRGPLRGWLRVAAVRTALNAKRDDRSDDHVDGDDALDAHATSSDPKLAYMRELYGAEFRNAFHAALATLTPDERAVLRLRYVEGLNVDKIGVLYQVHRATVARWLDRARDKIANTTREQLAARLALPVDEVDSLIGFVQSQLDVSIRTFLASDRT